MTHHQGVTPQPKDDDLLDIKQVAREIGVTRRTSVQRIWLMDPSFPRGVKIPGVKGKRWALGDVLAWKQLKLEMARRENAERLAAAKKAVRHAR